ncbi:MAG: hypothetical protein U0821_06040 [Chloroflexota bacterium]
MISGAIVIWRALVHLYDESLLMLKANLMWFFGSIPLFLLVLGVCWLFVPPTTLPAEGAEEAVPVLWPLMLSAFVLLVVPSPFSTALTALTAEIVEGETPEFALFWRTLRRWWLRSLLMFAVGAALLGALIFNTSFYASLTDSWLQPVAVVWLYGIVFWLTMQMYLVPIMLAAPEDAAGNEQASLLVIYKRAAILALANPIFSLVLFLAIVLIMVLCAVALPVYPLVAMSLSSLIGSRALKFLRDKYFPSETEAEGAE